MNDCCLMPNKQCLTYIMTRTSYIQRNEDDDVKNVLHQHTKLRKL